MKTRKTIVPLTPSGGGGGETKDRLKALIDERGASYLFYNYKGTEITTLQYGDTSNATSTESMFNICQNLINVPLLDTSSVIDMNNMFFACNKLKEIPQLDTSKVTNMAYMFANCQIITTIPQLDTSKVTNMSSTFSYCYKLNSIPQLDVSNVTDFYGAFSGCYSLKSILMYGMKVSFDISYSTQFEESDLVTILNNLAPVTSTKTLTMGSTNLAKLTDEEKAIATNKGWTLK